MDINIKKGRNILAVLAICFVAKIFLSYITFLNISDLSWYTPFFLIGIFVHTKTNNLSELYSNKTAICAGILLTISVLHIYASFELPFALDLIYKYTIALIGIAFSITVCLIIVKIQ